MDTSVPMESSRSLRANGSRRLGKFALVGALLVVIVGALGQLAWMYSGSGRWEPLPDKYGVYAWYLKVPGTSLVQYRGVTRFKATLQRVVSFMRDPSVCDEIGCYNSRILEKIDVLHEYQTFTYRYPFPFKPRQFVVMEQVSQDAGNNKVMVEYLGVPYKIPPESCCVRVPHMNNKWTFTPVGDGFVEVEYLIDIYEGGLMPAFYSNSIGKASVYEAPAGLAELINSDKYINKYQNASLDYIREGVITR